MTYDLSATRYQLRADLICPFFFKHDLDGLEQDHDVEPDGPVEHIPRIESEPVVKGELVPARHLPQSCDARRREQDRIDMVSHVVFLARQIRPRPDETHPPCNDVEYLRQFIHRSLSEKRPDPCHPRVI